ncbi:MAG: hypothetical protein J6I73_03960 [Treponema sp.]|nr:hypothetical protein [Treponema sp.]
MVADKQRIQKINKTLIVLYMLVLAYSSQLFAQTAHMSANAFCVGTGIVTPQLLAQTARTTESETTRDAATAVLARIRLVPDSRITRDMATQQPMDAETFARAACIASGVNESDMDAVMAQLHSAYAYVAAHLEHGMTQSEQAEKSLVLLYDSVLKKYSEAQTLPSEALASGAYNCVSSSIIYMYVMKRMNIPVTGVETPLHAFCIVHVDGKAIDVETTNPYGFNPGVRKVLESSKHKNAYYLVPAKNYASRKNVSDQRLVSLVFNNRISALQRRHQNDEAIALAVDAMALQNNSAQSFATVQTCINNTIADYGTSGKSEDALLLVEKAEAAFGSAEPYQKNAAAAVNNLVNAHTRRGDYESALATLEKHKSKLAQKDYATMRENATANLLISVVENEPLERALTLIRARESDLTKNRYTQLIVRAYSHKAQQIAERGAWLEAAAVLENGLQELPKNSELTKQRNVYRQNFAAEVHNEAAARYNAGDKAGAQSVIAAGLAKFPDSTLLKNDLQRMR